MLTELELSVVNMVYNTCSNTFAIVTPFTWTNGIIDVKSKPRNCIQKFYSYITWFLLLSTLVLKLSQLSSLVKSLDINSCIWFGLFLMKDLAHAVFKLSAGLYSFELARVINQSMHINSKWGSQVSEFQFISSDKREKAFIIFLLSAISGTIIVHVSELFSLYEILGRNGHLPTFFPYSTTATILTFIATELILSLDATTNFELGFCALYVFSIAMLHWLNKLCIEWPKTQGRCKKPEADVSIYQYRGLYILNTDFNTAFGKLLIPLLKLALILVFVISFFAFVALRKYLGIFSLAFVLLVISMSVFELIPITIILSRLYAVSKDFVPNLSKNIGFIKDESARKIVQMQLNGCQLIRCRVGSLYHMEAKAKLTVVHQMVNGVVYLLVNVKL